MQRSGAFSFSHIPPPGIFDRAKVSAALVSLKRNDGRSHSLAEGVLALIGIYGVVSYSVSLSRKEIGIRIALGATEFSVLRMVLGYGLRRVALGISVGVALALGCTRLLSSQLSGVPPADPWTYSGVSAVFAFAALAACYIPARRAAAIQPMRSLREQ